MPSAIHHIQAKMATDAILQKFKNGTWICGAISGTDFLRIGVSADFPSPDAAFHSPSKSAVIAFEFKPPTENKRGILTGVGQAIAYLQKSEYSFLIAPSTLDGFDLKSYLKALFEDKIKGKLSTGLIIYNCSNPSDVELVVNIEPSSVSSTRVSHTTIRRESRYWAKHLDTSIPFIHLLLHCYYLSSTHITLLDGYTYLWNTYIVRDDVRSTYLPVDNILDTHGDPIKTPKGNKNFIPLEKNLAKIRLSTAPITIKQANLNAILDTTSTGDTIFNQYKKNWVTFLKNVNLIDSSYQLTQLGFAYYHLGITNGPSSKIFNDYFTKLVLEEGHHLDLLFDFDQTVRNNPGSSLSNIRDIMERDYSSKGLVTYNVNRVTGSESKTQFLKNEISLWQALGLLDSNNIVNWKLVTSICAMKELE